MKLTHILSALVITVPAMASAQNVFAHFIVGNAGSYTTDQWKSDIQLAQQASIDGFVLNIAPPAAGAATITQVGNAFQAAQDLGSNFQLFFSFDYLGGGMPWAKEDVISLLKTYGGRANHFKKNGKPFVSTFEGVGNILDWPYIRTQIPNNIFFVPDWTSLGPLGFLASALGITDGAYSWDMWPNGPTGKTADSDNSWLAQLKPANKVYMMGVSPWFFTNLPAYQKAFVWRGDDLWHNRWMEVMTAKPDVVQIVTWNDFGESHYIGPIYNDGIPRADNANAHSYVDNMPHDHWRDLLPYYIAMYKNGGTAPSVSTDKLSFWYRLTPAAAGSANGVAGNNCKTSINVNGYQSCYSPTDIVEDKIFFTALVKEPSTVTLQVGGNQAQQFQATQPGLNHFSAPFNGQTGVVNFQIIRGESAVAKASGAAIQSTPSNGITNFNAWVGGTG